METIRVPLRDLKIARLTIPTKHGEMVISTSAYDVPHYMDLSVDHRAHTLQVRFGYVGEEDSAPRKVDENLTVLIGINSGKLVGIDARNISEKPGEVILSLVSGVERQFQHAKRDNQRLNYETIRDVIKDRGVQNRLTPLFSGA